MSILNNSLQANNLTPIPLIENFQRTRNVPLDTTQLISSINNFMIEIPEEVRYPGLRFFTVDEGSFYYFGNDLSTPILDNRLSNFVTVPQNGSNDYDYSVLNSLLISYKSPGQTVFIVPLGILLSYDGTDFIYLGGKYQVNNQFEWDSIPLNLKFQYREVNFQGNLQIISIDGTLTDQVIQLTDLNGVVFENNRYYKYNGDLYYFITGTLFNLTTTSAILSFQQNITLQISSDYIDPLVVDTSNVITHNLNSSQVMCQLIDSNNLAIDALFNIIDNNNILIKSLTIETFTVIVYKM
jgi:hypothetical protein